MGAADAGGFVEGLILQAKDIVALKINASSFAMKRELKLTDWGIEWIEGAAFTGNRKFTFGQIDFILLAADKTLSIQVGHEVFSLATKPKHQAIIQQLVASVSSAYQRVGGFPVMPPADPRTK